MKNGTTHTEFDIMRVLRTVLSKWYLFAITIPLFLFAAYWKNKNSRATHEIQAKILIEVKEDRFFYGDDVMRGLEHLFRSKTVNNEIEVLRSRDIIGRALDSLNLNTAHFKASRPKDEVALEKVPFELRVDYDKVDRLRGRPIEILCHQDEVFEIRIGEEHIGLFKRGQIISHEDFSFIIDRRTTFVPIPEQKEAFICYLTSKDDLITHYQNKLIAVESNKDTDAIVLSMKDGSADKGKAFLEQLLECYFLEILEDRKEIATNTYDFIDERVKRNFAHLDSVENAITEFKNNRNVTDPQAESRFILEGIKKFEVELSDAVTQLHIVKELEQKALMNPSSEMDLSVPNTMLGATDHLLIQLLKDLNDKQTELRHLAETVRPDNPMYKQLKNEVEDLRSSIMIDLINLRENMEITVTNIRSQIADYNYQLSQLADDDKGLQAMERMRKNKEEIFVYLLKKREEAALGLAAQMMDTWVLERPYVASSYYEPKKTVVLIIGLFLGIFFPLTSILLWLTLDKKVRVESDITEAVSLPIIGRIGFLPKETKSLDELATVNEAFKRMALNLRFMKDPYHCVMFTSMESGDGKTFSALHFARTLTNLGQKVCLVELDLRKPDLRDYLHGSQEKSLVDHLIHKAPLSDVIQKDMVQDGLSIIIGDVLPIDATQVLMSDRMGILINDLKRRYDMVVIDTPPVGIVADAISISRFADINVMVVREGHSTKKKLESMDKVIRDGSLNHLAVVINGMRSLPKEKYYKRSKKPRVSLDQTKKALNEMKWKG